MIKRRILKYILVILIVLQPVKLLSQVNVSLPDTSAVGNTFLFIPVIVSDLANQRIRSFEFTVSFDKNILKCEGIETEGSISNAFSWSTDESIKKSKVSVKASGLFSLRGSGNLIYLKFKVVGRSGSTELSWDSFRFNDGTPSAIESNGQFTVYGERQLQIANNDNGLGFIKVNDIGFELPYDQLLEQGKDYKIEAYPDTSSTFSEWSGDISTTQNPFIITLENDTDLEVSFVLRQVEITTEISHENSGSVEGSGIYNYGETATISAFPNSDWNFVNWMEDSEEVSKENIYSFKVTKQRTLTANFSNQVFNISADVEPSNSGNVIGSGDYRSGQIVELIAEPNDGWVFLEWVKDGEVVSSDSILNFTIEIEEHFTAKFVNNLNTVETISAPIDGGVTTGGGFYYFGQTTTLTATPNDGWRFSHWTVEDESISSENQIEVEIKGDLSFRANFEKILYTVTTFSSPIDGGNTTGGGFYFYNQNAEITSTANEGWQFSEWTENDTIVSVDPIFSININDHRNLIANYSLITDVEHEHNKPILSFVNNPYPNPFNPSTVFRFGIASESKVSLSIFDISGKLVSDLINSEMFQPGIYNRTFNASNLSQVSSGVYFYRFKSIEYNSDNILYESGKLLLIK